MKRTRRITLFILMALLVLSISAVSALPALACGGCGCPPGTGTPGYWMNHPEAWPKDVIKIGGMEYTKDEAIAIMKAPVKRDKTYTMFPALVAAKLNVKIGNPADCIWETVREANWWMYYNPVDSGVKGSSEAWQYSHGEALYLELDAYNNGKLCAPSRD